LYTATAISLLGSLFLEAFSFKLHLAVAELKNCLLFAKGSFLIHPNFQEVQEKKNPVTVGKQKKQAQPDSKS